MSTDAEVSDPISRSIGSRLWSAVLSFLVPGLGQAFTGRYTTGVPFIVVVAACHISLVLTVYLWSKVPGAAVLAAIVFIVVTGIVVSVWAAINAFGHKYKLRKLPYVRRYAVYAVFLIIALVPYDLISGSKHWKPYSYPSASMLPTIQPGDWFLAITDDYILHPPKRGDLVVFRLPADPSVELAKRIIGLPGDEVQMKGGILY